MDQYGRRIVLDLPFERTVSETTLALQSEGFDVVTTLDIREYLKRNAHHDCRRYLLLGALLPQLTLDAIRHDPELGPTLPTAIAVYELPDGETAVAAVTALAPVISEFARGPEQAAIVALADRGADRLAHALERLQHFSSRSLGGRKHQGDPRQLAT